jgi:hypothetical protein
MVHRDGYSTDGDSGRSFPVVLNILNTLHGTCSSRLLLTLFHSRYGDMGSRSISAIQIILSALQDNIYGFFQGLQAYESPTRAMGIGGT